MAMVGTKSGALVALLSAHQSIGVPQPLKLFGTEEQKKRFLPRLAKGAISAFALTENDVGSDPARMATTALPTADGSAYLLNGEKLWCTNGTHAELLVVMARTPGKEGKPGPISAFIVETAWPGVEVVERLEFMGVRGIENGLMRFTNVRVPKENLLWGEGKGPEARAHHAQHRAPHAARDLRGGGESGACRWRAASPPSACSGGSRSASTRRWRR
jgi:alkylation response protein AidB-like acyl-CoA dehydrogenase